MNITLEDIKATLIRIQGQFDVWNGLYQQALKDEELKNAEKESASAKKDN